MEEKKENEKKKNTTNYSVEKFFLPADVSPFIDLYIFIVSAIARKFSKAVILYLLFASLFKGWKEEEKGRKKRRIVRQCTLFLFLNMISRKG